MRDVLTNFQLLTQAIKMSANASGTTGFTE